MVRYELHMGQTFGTAAIRRPSTENADAMTWWRREDTLKAVLPFINASRRCGEQIERCRSLTLAVDKASSYLQRVRQLGQPNEMENRDVSLAKSIQELLLRGLSADGAHGLCRGDSVRRLAELRPHVLDHHTLLRKQYDPHYLTDEVRDEASEEHQQFERALRRYSETPGDAALREPLLKKIAKIVYIVRNNIAHSEKTPNGPDVAKRQRDRAVSEAMADVIDELFDLMFDRPSRRLAVYGTLVPGGANASHLAGLGGAWSDGATTGRLELPEGLHSFTWEYPGTDLPVKVLCSSQLQAHLPVLDAFEGHSYCRILVPVRLPSGLVVCNIYEGRA